MTRIKVQEVMDYIVKLTGLRVSVAACRDVGHTHKDVAAWQDQVMQETQEFLRKLIPDTQLEVIVSNPPSDCNSA